MSQTTDNDTDVRIEAVKAEVRDDKSESTASRYLHAVDGFLAYLEGSGIDPFNVVSVDFKKYMQGSVDDEYAYGSLRPRMYGIRAFYQAAEDLYDEQQELKEAGRDIGSAEIPEVMDPTAQYSLNDFVDDKRSKQSKGLEASDEHHKLTQDEIDQLAANAPSPRNRNVLIIRLMYQCCLRRSELVRLKVSDVDTENRTIDVPAVKGNKGRDSPIPYRATLDETLSLWLNVERKGVAKSAESDYLFPTARSEHITERHVTEIVGKAAAESGLQEPLYTDAGGTERQKIHSHTLRASGAHRFWDNTGDIYFVAKILGHKNADGTPAIETTKRYLDADSDEIISKARNNWNDD